MRIRIHGRIRCHASLSLDETKTPGLTKLQSLNPNLLLSSWPRSHDHSRRRRRSTRAASSRRSQLKHEYYWNPPVNLNTRSTGFKDLRFPKSSNLRSTLANIRASKSSLLRLQCSGIWKFCAGVFSHRDGLGFA